MKFIKTLPRFGPELGILETLYKERSRFVLWLPVFFMIGILFYFNLKEEPTKIAVLFPLCLLILLFIFLYKNIIIRCFILILIFFDLGFSIAYIRTHSLDTYLIKEKIEDFKFKAIVDEQEYSPHTKKYKLTLQIFDHPLIKKVKISYIGETVPEIGDYLEGVATLFPFSDPVSMCSYDFRQNAYFNNISASGKLNEIILHKKDDSKNLKKTRTDLTQFIRTKMQGQVAEVAIAVTSGFRNGITQETRQEFANSGLSHILAISGLHISLVAGLLFLIIRRILALIPSITMRYNTKKWACALSIPATFYYVALSGFGYPSIRAFCMTSLIFFSIIIDRFALSMRSIAIAAFVILLLFPESALSVSFQLSFAAVLGLIAFYEKPWQFLRNKTLEKNVFYQMGSYILGVSMTTLIATLATTPISLFYFNQLTLNAVFANMLAIPLTGFCIMPCALICVLSYFIGDFQILFDIWGVSIQLLIDIAKYVSSWEGSFIALPQPSNLYICLFGIGFLWLCLFQTNLRFLSLPFLIAAPFTFFDQSHLPDVYVEKSVIAYKHNNRFMISHLEKGKFFTTQWAQEQGNRTPTLFSNNIVLIDDLTIVYDPWKNEPIKTCPNKIITNGFIKKCKKETVLDRTLLKKNGTHLIWLHPFKIRNVKEMLGHRPWVA